MAVQVAARRSLSVTGSLVSMMLSRLLLVSGAVVLFLAAVVPVRAGEPDMAYIGLMGYGLYSMQVTADRQILLGSSGGVWQVSADGQRVSPFSGLGLPVTTCSVAAESTDETGPCYIPSLVVNSRGDIFAVLSNDSLPGRLYRWLSGGKVWEAVPGASQMLRSDDDSVGLVAVAPDGTLYVTVSFWFRGPRAAVYRSADGGVTWAEVAYLGGDYWETIDSLAVSPEGQVWLGGGKLGSSHWMRVSSDGGATWTTRTVIPETANQLTDSHNTLDYAFDGAGGVYVTTAGGGGDYPAGVYRSFDGGVIWERLASSEANRDLGAVALTADRHICYSAQGSVRCSADDGVSWTVLTFRADYPPTYVKDLLIDSDGHLWAATESRGLSVAANAGLYRSQQPVGAGWPLQPEVE